MDMSHIVTSWKTTLAGVATIFTALGDMAHQASTGAVDPDRLWADGMGIAAGLGLIFAKDSNVTGGTTKQ